MLSELCRLPPSALRLPHKLRSNQIEFTNLCTHRRCRIALCRRVGLAASASRTHHPKVLRAISSQHAPSPPTLNAPSASHACRCIRTQISHSANLIKKFEFKVDSFSAPTDGRRSCSCSTKFVCDPRMGRKICDGGPVGAH